MVPRRIGRYVIGKELARGGMASVHLGRLVADRGFSRLVAIKLLGHDQARSSFHRKALEDEARIASRIRHPNVVQPVDVLESGGDFFVVMEYVHGVSLSQLFAAARFVDRPLSPPVVVAVLLDVLKGLQAAHEALDEKGRPLGIVHRDVSPQNILIGTDGVARLADFGVAKVMRREEKTMTGAIKGKPSYMPPEQLRGLPLTRQADLYAVGVVLAEALAGVAPRAPDDDPEDWRANALAKIKEPALAEVARAATRDDARERYATAAEMSAALAAAVAPAQADEVADQVTGLAGDEIDERAALVREVEAMVVPVESDPAPAVAARPAPPPTPSVEEVSFELLPTPPPAPAEALHEEPVVEKPRPRARRPPPPARSPLVVFLVGCCLALLVGGLYLRTRTVAADPDPIPPPSTAGGDPVGSVASSPPPSPPIVASPRTSVAGDPSPTPVPHGTRATSHTAKPGAGRIAGTTEKPASRCDPPFSIDAQGVKHYKPECEKK